MVNTLSKSLSLGLSSLSLSGAFGVDPGAAAAAAAVTVTFTESDVNATLATTTTFSDKSFSTADANRIIVILVSMEGGSESATSVTIGGVGGSKIISLNNSSETVDIWAAAVPTGTTGDVVVVTPQANIVGIGIYAMYDASIVPNDTGTNTAAPASTTINCPADGVVFGTCILRSNTNRTFTWAGITTENYDEIIKTADATHTGAFDLFAAEQTGLTVTCTASGAGVRNPVMALASFGYATEPGDPSLPAISDTLLAHYRADLGVTKDGSDLVSVWADQSGNGYNLLQDTVGDLPTWVASGIGSKNTIRGDGTGTFMNAVFTKAQPYHIFVIINQISWSDSPTRVVVGGIINDSHPAFIQRTSSPQLQQNAGIGTGNAISPAIGTDSLIHGYWSGASSYLVLDDGAQQGATNPGTVGITALTVFGKDDSHFANVDIAEICIYATEVTGSDLTILEDYFNTRYTLGFS